MVLELSRYRPNNGTAFDAADWIGRLAALEDVAAQACDSRSSSAYLSDAWPKEHHLCQHDAATFATLASHWCIYRGKRDVIDLAIRRNCWPEARYEIGTITRETNK